MEEYYYERSNRSSRWRRFLGLLAAALLGGMIVLLCLPALLPYLMPESAANNQEHKTPSCPGTIRIRILLKCQIWNISRQQLSLQ